MAQLVDTARQKPECGGFDTLTVLLEFFLPHYVPEVSL
jgi:hypothetical protein